MTDPSVCGHTVLLEVEDLRHRVHCVCSPGHTGEHSNGIFAWTEEA